MTQHIGIVAGSAEGAALCAKGIPEDPVTGAAHCMLAPYWARQLGKTKFRAFQASRRGGEIICRLVRDRIELEGTCVFYLEGEVDI